jgi:hypothetical protein
MSVAILDRPYEKGENVISDFFIEECNDRLDTLKEMGGHITLDRGAIIWGGTEIPVSIYEPHTLDGFYLVLGDQGEHGVKWFPYEISAHEATTLVAHYGGCPCDLAEYLECLDYDLGLSYTPESWDENH